MKLEFSRHIFVKYSNFQDFMKFRPVRAELSHADGRTDLVKLTVAFCKLASASKNGKERFSITQFLVLV
jgi:hypothetical protein